MSEETKQNQEVQDKEEPEAQEENITVKRVNLLELFGYEQAFEELI